MPMKDWTHHNLHIMKEGAVSWWERPEDGTKSFCFCPASRVAPLHTATNVNLSKQSLFFIDMPSSGKKFIGFEIEVL